MCINIQKGQLDRIAGTASVRDKPDVLESHSRDFSQSTQNSGIKTYDSL